MHADVSSGLAVRLGYRLLNPLGSQVPSPETEPAWLPEVYDVSELQWL